MQWTPFKSEEQIADILKASTQKTQVIFKHSTRCIISTMAKQRVEKYADTNLDFHYLDLIENRTLSNKIAEHFNVQHQSPQILVIKNNECVFDESHGGIQIDDLKDF